MLGAREQVCGANLRFHPVNQCLNNIGNPVVEGYFSNLAHNAVSSSVSVGASYPIRLSIL